MNREKAINYLRSSGFSEEQIAEIEQAFKGEPCEDAISRSAALALAKEISVPTGNAYVYYSHRCIDPQEIRALPSVSTEKTGQWKRISIDKYVQHAMAYYRCSECGKDNIGESNFCPNCGARMVEPQPYKGESEE